ncbi:hypothetical protein [Streptomyces melanogenes]|uniref:hypothetical protein n=1 Tax=Streptomyces melanogenes TaxID=67326 RepID=UPI00378BAD0D
MIQREVADSRLGPTGEHRWGGGLLPAHPGGSPGWWPSQDIDAVGPVDPIGVKVLKPRLVSLTIAAAALIGCSVAASPAAYAVSCYGSTCSNKGPKGSGCDANASNLRNYVLKGGYYELRWSKACHAGWVRASGAGAAGASAVIQRVLLDGGGGVDVQEERAVAVNKGELDWSNMVGTNYGAYYRVCGTYFNFPDSTLDCSPLVYQD